MRDVEVDEGVDEGAWAGSGVGQRDRRWLVAKRRRKYGFSWSWRRAVGLSGLKAKVSRKTHVPLTTSGRERKVGRIVLRALGLRKRRKRRPWWW